MTAANYYERKDCRFCGSKNLSLYLDLGAQPPSNSFIAADDVKNEEKFPLRIFLCQDCGLSQLTGVVSAKHIFNEYQYLSSVSKALVAHYRALVEDVVKKFSVKDDAGVMDIGCNDGIMLDGYPKTFSKRIGVEPSSVASIAESKGHTVYKSFFNEDTAKTILSEKGPVRVITATNVFAHIDDIHSVVKGVAYLLSNDGLFIIETPYIKDMVDQNLFDTIYHEHLCYLGVTSLSYLMNKHGLEIFDVERVSLGASGPAIRVFSQRKGGPQKIKATVAALLNEEEKWGVKKLEPYKKFAERIKSVKKDLVALLQSLKKQGSSIGAYGAPAKGNTLLNTFEIGPDLVSAGVAETNELKIGKLTPGSHLPIVDEKLFLEKKPDYAILLAWNYADFFVKNSPYIKNGGRFIVPLPKPEILP